MNNVLVVLALLVPGSLCIADDGGVTGIGGTVQLMNPEHATIRMVRERVDVVIYPDKPMVRCTFIFRNEGKATTVKMGFPEESAGAGTPSPDSKEPALIDFKSWVDGKPTKTTFMPDKHNNDQSFRGWHVKEVPFKAGQTRTVVDTYIGGLGGDVTGAADFGYTLVSGKSWKGPIGEAIITVDVNPFKSKYQATNAYPKGYTRRKSVFQWVMKNFEPKENIGITFQPATIVTILPIDGENKAWGMFCEKGKDGITMVYIEFLIKDISIEGKSVTLRENGHTLLLTLGSKTAMADGKKISLPRAPEILKHYKDDTSGSLVVPAAAVVRALGGKVTTKWEKGLYYMDIQMKATPSPEH